MSHRAVDARSSPRLGRTRRDAIVQLMTMPAYPWCGRCRSSRSTPLRSQAVGYRKRIAGGGWATWLLRRGSVRGTVFFGSWKWHRCVGAVAHPSDPGWQEGRDAAVTAVARLVVLRAEGEPRGVRARRRTLGRKPRSTAATPALLPRRNGRVADWSVRSASARWRMTDEELGPPRRARTGEARTRAPRRPAPRPRRALPRWCVPQFLLARGRVRGRAGFASLLSAPAWADRVAGQYTH